MKNKIKKLFKKPAFVKNIKLIHVLLIILILVVFFGLFKREIPQFTENFIGTVEYILPQVKNQAYSIKVSCKVKVENPKWKEEYVKECGSDGMTPIDNSYQAIIRCIKPDEIINGQPRYQGFKDGTCPGIATQKQFWVLGLYWFDVK